MQIKRVKSSSCPSVGLSVHTFFLPNHQCEPYLEGFFSKTWRPLHFFFLILKYPSPPSQYYWFCSFRLMNSSSVCALVFLFCCLLTYTLLVKNVKLPARAVHDVACKSSWSTPVSWWVQLLIYFSVIWNFAIPELTAWLRNSWSGFILIVFFLGKF